MPFDLLGDDGDDLLITKSTTRKAVRVAGWPRGCEASYVKPATTEEA
jgi:hypothetical protein